MLQSQYILIKQEQSFYVSPPSETNPDFPHKVLIVCAFGAPCN
jgi:hypothetical protein